MIDFSNLYRKKMVGKLQKKEYDLLIIGGGITGAGIALDAVSRGMKVALLEKNDFASGTSSKSTKLIHGGLRYLKQFDFFLVREVGMERAIIHGLAPHLVVPDKMLLPIIEEGTYGSWLTSIGLKIYDVLASVEGDDKRKMLNKKEALEKEPLLPPDILEGAGYYAEYRTDDARLTTEVLKTAYGKGAKILNYCEVKAFLREDNKVKGVRALDHLSNETFEVRSKYVINATGPWVDRVRSALDNDDLKGKRLLPTKGVHLVFPREKFPLKQSVYFDVPDGRMIFGIPRGRVTYVGTTDTKYFDDLDKVETLREDATYLIDAVNQMFPEIELKLEDVESSWAGLRPLIYEEGKSASELSRKDEVFESENGLISIAGGKLTGYRKMAERVVDVVARRLLIERELEFRKVQTENITLTRVPFPNYKSVKRFIEQMHAMMQPEGFGKEDTITLVHNFGHDAEIIFDKYAELEEEDREVRMAKAELWYCVNFEMVALALDFFERRTGRMYFDVPSIEKLKVPVVDEMARLLAWSDDQKSGQLQILNEKLAEVTNFN
jgi:glycerol-3-phosphate dehydrogenase